LEAKAGNVLTIGKINTDEQPELAAQFAVQYIPTLYVRKDGKYSEKLVAPSSLEQLEAWLKEQNIL
jgi:thioredoxin 1